jgi:hypothetical protein
MPELRAGVVTGIPLAYHPAHPRGRPVRQVLRDLVLTCVEDPASAHAIRVLAGLDARGITNIDLRAFASRVGDGVAAAPVVATAVARGDADGHVSCTAAQFESQHGTVLLVDKPAKLVEVVVVASGESVCFAPHHLVSFTHSWFDENPSLPLTGEPFLCTGKELKILVSAAWVGTGGPRDLEVFRVARPHMLGLARFCSVAQRWFTPLAAGESWADAVRRRCALEVVLHLDASLRRVLHDLVVASVDESDVWIISGLRHYGVVPDDLHALARRLER